MLGQKLGQILEKPCVHSREQGYDPVFMKLCQKFYLYRIQGRFEIWFFRSATRSLVYRSNLRKTLCALYGAEF